MSLKNHSKLEIFSLSFKSLYLLYFCIYIHSNYNPYVFTFTQTNLYDLSDNSQPFKQPYNHLMP